MYHSFTCIAYDHAQNLQRGNSLGRGGLLVRLSSESIEAVNFGKDAFAFKPVLYAVNASQ